jgi:hypothetical protein
MNDCTFSKLYRSVTLGIAVTLFLAGAAVKAQTAPQQDTTNRDSVAATATSPLSSEIASTSVAAETLPDAPSAQVETPQQAGTPGAKQEDQTHINPIPLLSPRLLSGTSLKFHDKFEIYIHKAYSPAAVIYPLFGAGIKMARPTKDYPEDWQDGMGAFGRNYGNAVAQRTAKTTAEFGTEVLLHEDPRYERSDSTNPILRVGHAMSWTLFDKNDSGHRTLAVSTFTSAAAGGFVGMAYLPDGYNDVTHAEQRMFVAISGRAITNVLTEFEPTWGPWARKLRIPKLLPEWWVPDHK